MDELKEKVGNSIVYDLVCRLPIMTSLSEIEESVISINDGKDDQIKIVVFYKDISRCLKVNNDNIK